jgi:hypothetical protein
MEMSGPERSAAAWAPGFYFTGSTLRPLVIRWNGKG